MATQIRSNKKKKKINQNGIVHIKATFNNTNITVSDEFGNVVAWATAGKAGFKGSRKNTAYAATVASEKVASEVASMGMTTVAVRVKGPGAGRESAIRALSTAGLQVTSISDVTPLPHNGCRPKKQRRV
jgi:30S ribosomal protein S11|tara:strand:- start:147 stop:533 length:387 start_codon:yes stop_codon:yes gene_type:complete